MGSYEERLDHADCYNPFFLDDPDASSFGISLNLSEEPGSLLLFLWNDLISRVRRRYCDVYSQGESTLTYIH